MSVMKNHGFTVVELIVVIVVIGILAGIAAVVWPNYMKQTHDTERRNDLEQIASALKVYALQKNSKMTTSSGCGKDGNGNGWVSAAGTVNGSSYPKSIMACLQEIEALPGEPFDDPSGCTYNSGGTCSTPVPAYMKATCLTGGVETTYLFAYLETEPANVATIDGLCTDGTVSGFDASTQKWGSLYGMNYYLKVN